MIYYWAIYDILLCNIWYITLQYMIYYFTIYDILHHESIAQEALEYAFASFGACLCKHWSMMVEALPDWTASTGRPPSSRTAATSQRAGSTAGRPPILAARCRHSALGTFQNNSKSRKQLILRNLRDFSFYNNSLFAPQVYPYILAIIYCLTQNNWKQ